MIPPEIRRILPSRMRRLNLSANILSQLSGVNAAQLSRFLSNKVMLEPDEAIRLLEAVELCERLASLASPVPVDWRNTPLILELGQRLNEGSLTIRVEDTHREPLRHDFGALSGADVKIEEIVETVSTSHTLAGQ